jgi:hypothetical protein
VKLPSRHAQWEPRLAAVVADWTGREHAPKPGHDCVAFVMACIEAVTGERLAFEVGTYRTVAEQYRALKEAGFASLDAAADACLGGRIAPLQAHRGDVLSDGGVLGVMAMHGPVAFGEAGMVQLQRRGIVAAWPVGRAD